MATISSQVTTYIYGEIQGGPPYVGANPFARQITYGTPQHMALPTGSNIWPLSQGIRFGNYYAYSIVERPPAGLNQPSKKFASGDSVATLVTGSTL